VDVDVVMIMLPSLYLYLCWST